jgi:hypothetical protein
MESAVDASVITLHVAVTDSRQKPRSSNHELPIFYCNYVLNKGLHLCL